MTVVVLLYWTDLPYSVETCPRCIQANGLAKPPENLLFLLLTEQQFASGRTFKLEDQFGLLISELLLDLASHLIEPSGDLLLISAREPDARALLDLRLYSDGPVSHPNCRYASNDVLFVFHVARGFENERKRYGVRHPVAVVGEGLLW